jgi:phage tail-like protein
VSLEIRPDPEPRDGHDGAIVDLAPAAALALRRNGHEAGLAIPLAPSTAPPSGTRLLQYLPAIFQGDDFTTRFLCIFGDILDPLERMVGQLPDYFDPATAPPELLEQLAEWVSLDAGADWPDAQRRALAGQAVRIYGNRGTTQGLRLYLRALTGHAPLIVENGDGFRLGGDARLGYNTLLGRERPGWFTVTVLVANATALDDDLVRRAIESEKPFGTRYLLRFAAVSSRTR